MENLRNSVAASLSIKMLSMFCFIALFLFDCSYADGYHPVTMPVNWELAEKMCQNSEVMLIPDMYDEIESTDLYSELPVGKFVWINAKSVEIHYPSSTETIKLAYKPVNSELKHYLCRDAAKLSTRRKTGRTLSTWVKARQLGENFRCDLLNVSTADNVKSVVSLLRHNQAAWVNKYPDYKLPHSVLNGFDVKCLGMIRQSNGSVSMAADHCAHKHMYICVDDKDDSAPTVTRLNMTLPLYVHPPPPETSTIKGINETVSEEIMSLRNATHSDVADSGGLVGDSFGLYFTPLILILLLLPGVLYCRKRWLNRQAYETSLRNETCRQNSRRIDTGTFNGDTINSVNSTENEVESYEGNDPDVAHLQKVHGYVYGRIAGRGSKQEKLAEVESYEGDDPDVAHLQKVHGYVDGRRAGQQTWEQYDFAMTGEVPKLPKKKKRNTL